MTGSAVTSAGLNSPLGWIKNLGPGTVYMRGDGTAAGIDQAGSYPLYAGPGLGARGRQRRAYDQPRGAVRHHRLGHPGEGDLGHRGRRRRRARGFTDADVDAAIPAVHPVQPCRTSACSTRS
jgi:hypothetical protein